VIAGLPTCGLGHVKPLALLTCATVNKVHFNLSSNFPCVQRNPSMDILDFFIFI
jgi:hypothetical protein